MLIIDIYIITGCAAFAVYFTYRRIEHRALPAGWRNSVGGAHTLFFQKLHDQFHGKLAKSETLAGLEEDDDLFDVPLPVLEKTPTWIRVCQVERETFVQLGDLRGTDVIKVESGEMIPVKGVVIEGDAWVLTHQNPYNFHLTSGDIAANVQQCTVGDRVDAQKIVMVGSLKMTPDLSG